MEFGEKLKKICKDEKLNLREFSDLTDIPYDSVRQYSRGRRTPAWEQIQKIANTPKFEKYKKFLLSESEELSSESYPEDLTEEEKVALNMFRAEIAKGTSPDLIFQAMENIQNQEDE